MKVVINSNIERENDKLTNAFVTNYSGENDIKFVLSRIESLKNDTVLNRSVYFVVEDNIFYKNKEKLIDKEIRRSIGYTDKIRVVLMIQDIDKATLIIKANNTKVSYSKMVSLYKYIIGEENVFVDDFFVKNNNYMGTDSLSWGVPSWDAQQIFTNCNSVYISEENCEEIKKCTKDSVINALMATLYKYKSTSAKVLIKENTYETSNVRVAIIDENQEIAIAEKESSDKNAVEFFKVGAEFTDVEDESIEYYPCMTAIYPITLCVTENHHKIRSIRIMASEKIVNAVVLEQFAQLFIFYLNGLKEKNGNVIRMSNRLKFENEIGVGISVPDNTKEMEKYSKYNLVKMINEISNKYADRIAVSYKDTELKYSELAEQSNSLAKILLKKGVKPGEKIVISVPQDEKLIILIQAIIKAGAVYIPVDPGYPMERIAFIVQDSQASFVISNNTSGEFGKEVLNISYEELLNSDENVKDIQLPENLDKNGYVIYTSGTTGKPKGVSVPSKNIVALINATREEFDLNENDVWTMFHSYSFDFSVWEMWGCLLTGGKLVIVPRETAKSHYDLHALLIEKKVTVFNQTPASFYALQNVDSEKRGAQLTSIRLIIFGGEALDTAKLQLWFKRYPSTKCRLVNMYGITETTVHVTYRDVHCREQAYLNKSVGKALKGWEISIRNKDGQRCLVGMEGEIWISGVGVANGYLNRNELNKEKFVVDENNTKWYRSGDLGRFRVDGSIDYLGRIDNQVKIRGFRIELDEIKNVLLKIPYVEDSVVTVVSNDGEDAARKQLYGFIKVKEEHEQAEIKKYLSMRLPDYMIPNKIVNVAEIPMTINGKVDYKLLIANSNKCQVECKKAHKQEFDLCIQIWSEVLGNQVSEDDEFFNTGGNSLLAVELISKLKRRIDSTLTLKDLYLNSTPRKMKRLIEKKKGGLSLND
ncbi:MAG: amino acid adenylation domain-containing protein [Clostridium sp.]|nr:amino acid adenylation domain-containing protein [Clostridium sp.]